MAGHETRRPRRRWLFALLAIVLLGVAASLALRHFTRPQTLTAMLVEQIRGTLGADLSLGGNAHFAFVPKLHLVLPRPTLKAVGATAPFLGADSLDVVMPWRTLWGDRYDIEHVELVKPVLDLDAFSAWFKSRPSSGTPADVRFSLRVDDGTITAAGKPAAQGVKMEFANSGDLAAWLAKLASVTPAAELLPPLHGTTTAASLQIGSTHLDDVRVEIRDDDAKPPTMPPPAGP